MSWHEIGLDGIETRWTINIHRIPRAKPSEIDGSSSSVKMRPWTSISSLLIALMVLPFEIALLNSPAALDDSTSFLTLKHSRVS